MATLTTSTSEQTTLYPTKVKCRECGGPVYAMNKLELRLIFPVAKRRLLAVPGLPAGAGEGVGAEMKTKAKVNRPAPRQVIRQQRQCPTCGRWGELS